MDALNNVSLAGLEAAVAASQLSSADKTGKEGDVVPAKSQYTLNELLDELSLPTLPATVGSVSLDTLLGAVAEEDRRTQMKSAVKTIEAKGAARDAENARQLEEMQKQLEQMRKKSVLSGFLKVFKAIAMVFSAVVAVATTAVGVMSANPCLVAGGVMAALMLVDNILDTATDGKFSLNAGLTALGEKMFGEKGGKVFAMVVQGLITVASMVLGGVGAYKAAHQVADISVKSVASVVSSAGQVGEGISQGVTGGLTIGEAVVDLQIAKSKAKTIDIDAILEQLRESVKNDEDLLKALQETTQNLLTDVKDIVDQCGETNTAILTASPSMA